MIMARERHGQPAVSRRDFLVTTGGRLIGAAEAAARRPKRGGTLRLGTRGDSTGLDPHRNLMYLVSQPLAATTQGLLDLDLQCEPVPGIATEWDISLDLLTYTFKLRQGALFHNGREIDAAAVKWNFERIQNPKTSHAFARSALSNLKETAAVDKYTVRCQWHETSAAFLSNIVYYPCNLMAPDSAAQTNTARDSAMPRRTNSSWKPGARQIEPSGSICMPRSTASSTTSCRFSICTT
jgi:peptide/nickel transport system substrate-binding protein